MGVRCWGFNMRKPAQTSVRQAAYSQIMDLRAELVVSVELHCDSETQATHF